MNTRSESDVVKRKAHLGARRSNKSTRSRSTSISLGSRNTSLSLGTRLTVSTLNLKDKISVTNSWSSFNDYLDKSRFLQGIRQIQRVQQGQPLHDHPIGMESHKNTHPYISKIQILTLQKCNWLLNKWRKTYRGTARAAGSNSAKRARLTLKSHAKEIR